MLKSKRITPTSLATVWKRVSDLLKLCHSRIEWLWTRQSSKMVCIVQYKNSVPGCSANPQLHRSTNFDPWIGRNNSIYMPPMNGPTRKIVGMRSLKKTRKVPGKRIWLFVCVTAILGFGPIFRDSYPRSTAFCTLTLSQAPKIPRELKEHSSILKAPPLGQEVYRDGWSWAWGLRTRDRIENMAGWIFGQLRFDTSLSFITRWDRVLDRCILQRGSLVCYQLFKTDSKNVNVFGVDRDPVK